MAADSLRRPGRQRGVSTLLYGLFILATGLVAGLCLGWLVASGTPASVRSVRVEYSSLEQELQAARRELVAANTRNEVDRKALEMVRAELAHQNSDIAELREDLKFYRNLMSPEEGQDTGLSVTAPELVALDGAGRYAYRLVVQQQARKHEVVTANLAVTIVAEAGGLEVSYPLAELSDDVDGQSLPLQFRYFQSLEGTLVLPEGATPLHVEVSVTASEPRSLELTENFPWQLQERFSDVGK